MGTIGWLLCVPFGSRHLFGPITFEYGNSAQHRFLRDVVTDTLEIAGGARWTDEKRDLSFRTPFLHEILIGLGALNNNLAEYEEFVASCYAGQTQEAGCNLRASDSTPGSAGVAQDLSGETLSVAPEWTAIYGATWETALGNSGWRGACDSLPATRLSR